MRKNLPINIIGRVFRKGEFLCCPEGEVPKRRPSHTNDGDFFPFSNRESGALWYKVSGTMATRMTLSSESGLSSQHHHLLHTSPCSGKVG